MNNPYQELSDDILCIICFEKVNSQQQISNFCSKCNITMHYNCLYQWCISNNHNKCPICLNPIDKIIDIINNDNNNNDNNNDYNDYIIDFVNNSLKYKIICIILSSFFIFIYFHSIHH